MNSFFPKLKLGFWSRISTFIFRFNLSVEEVFNWFYPHIKFLLEFLDSFAFTHTHKLIKFLWFNFKVLFSRLHKLHCLNNFFFELFNLSCKLLSSLCFNLTPILITLAIYKRIINIIHHKIEDSNRIRGNFTVKYLLIACYTCIDFLFVFRKISHEPYCLLLNFLWVTICHKNSGINYVVIIIRSSIWGLIINQYLCRSFTIQKQINFFLIGFIRC